MTRGRRGTRGFSLLEIMGVLVVMALLLGFATDYYIDLSRASNRASRNTTDVREATAILDRVARDFEGATLMVKPADLDPLAHPWLFVGESQYSQSGADHVKFVTRNFQHRRTGEHESDLAMVAYTLQPNDLDGGLELYRWSAPQLPESLDRSFPPSDDDASFLLADGIADFGIIFFGDDAESDTWDSTTLLQSGMLPNSVEITVAMLDPDAPEIAEGGEIDPENLVYYSRRVRIPVRPIDMAALLDPEGAGGAGSEDEEDGEEGSGEDGAGGSGTKSASGLTVGDCLDFAGLSAEAQQTMPGFSGFDRSSGNMPWDDLKNLLTPELRRFVVDKPGCR